MLKSLKSSLLLISLLIFMNGCNISEVFSKSANLPKQVTGTWEGQMEVNGFMNSKQTHNIRVHINLKDKPYFMNIKIAGEEIKIDIAKFTIHKEDNAIQYYSKDSKNGAFIMLIDKKNIQLKGTKTVDLKKIVSTY